MRIQSEANLYEKLYIRTNEFLEYDRFKDFNIAWIDNPERGYFKISFNDSNNKWIVRDNTDEIRIYTENGFNPNSWASDSEVCSIYYGQETESKTFDCSILVQDIRVCKYIERLVKRQQKLLESELNNVKGAIK
jgi:hypothetical protein|tara:strand:- start:7266 stop:7667 length:402 start_codon:yes stop_codon:yes gene_type:complete